MLEDVFKYSCPECRECAACSDSPMKPQKPVRESKGEEEMKYILMMGGAKAGWDTFEAWPKKDIHAHIAFMKGFNKERSIGAYQLQAAIAAVHDAMPSPRLWSTARPRDSPCCMRSTPMGV